MQIHTWKQFGRIVRPKGNLLAQTGDFTDPVFISGCQRSGGTMLAKVITGHETMADFSWSKDAELDAAIILSGQRQLDIVGRCCLQTTYLNEQYFEFAELTNPFKLIWLIRNPDSVVCSMLYNWKRFALNELFLSCGREQLNKQQEMKLNRWGVWSIKPIERACLSYVGKVRQLEFLTKSLTEDQLLVIEYESLVQNSEPTLKTICDFLGLPWSAKFGSVINQKSLAKAERISDQERTTIAQLCATAYARSRELAKS